MCTHSCWIYNKYSHRKVLVSCGKCPACLQAKANRSAERIRNNVNHGTIALFITLTYTNDFVPYVLRSDLKDNKSDEINVYRNTSGRWIFDRHSNVTRFKKDYQVDIVDRLCLYDIDTCSDAVVSKYPHLVGLSNDCIGVCYFPDLQNFFKRLRNILYRDYNYDGNFSYFACSELGGATYRPHFHALLFIRPDDEKTFRGAILKAWPFADSRRTEKYIEIAKDAASYVSSYINSNVSLLSLFKEDVFKPKHSISKGFGVVLECFSLGSILSKIDKGNLLYYRKQKLDGDSAVASLPIPKYILNRYFPQFKGFSWFSAHELLCLLYSPERVGYVLRDASVRLRYFTDSCFYDLQFNSVPKFVSPVYHYTCKETYGIYIRLCNAYQRFHACCGLGIYDYAYYFVRCWQIYASQSLKLSYEECDSFESFSDFYCNINEFDDERIYQVAPTLQGLDLQKDYNKRLDVVHKSDNLCQLFYKKDKTKKVNNYVMASNGHNV